MLLHTTTGTTEQPPADFVKFYKNREENSPHFQVRRNLFKIEIIRDSTAPLRDSSSSYDLLITEDCFALLGAEQVTRPQLWHYHARSLVSHFHARSSYSYQYQFHVRGKVIRLFLRHHTKSVFVFLKIILSRFTRGKRHLFMSKYAPSHAKSAL